MAWILYIHVLLTPTATSSETMGTSFERQKDVLPSKAIVTPESKFAYASLIGGVDPSKPSYKGFLYNILISAKILKAAGSTADMVVFFQLSHTTSMEELPPKVVRLLEALGVTIFYIPKSKHQGFYEITLEKFRILGLVQYERVLFMDADVMPLGNLDYLMEMSLASATGSTTITGSSVAPRLQENVVIAGTQEPSTAGFFLLAPGGLDDNKLDKLHQVIATRERNAKDLPFPKFDVVNGWGHAIRPPDHWKTRVSTRSGTNWTFYAADADQGLLYEWAKYVEQKVSIVIGNSVQNWVPGIDGYPRLVDTLEKPFQKFNSRLSSWARGPPPYRHFHHFTGRSKPWEGGMPENAGDEATHKTSPEHFWFYHLLELNLEYALFDANDWEAERAKISAPPLGRFHVKADMANRVNRNNP